MKIKLLLFPLLLAVLLACDVAVPFVQSQTEVHFQQVIGFDFVGQVPQIPTGDRSAATHLFIHKYPFPTDGCVTGLTFLNDSDTGSEPFTLLILHPTDGGWQVIHRVDIESEDQTPAKSGLVMVRFDTALCAEKGDSFAHWQFAETGPIPLNDEKSPVEGLSFGKFGISTEEIQAGQIIQNQGFSGGRDYFINVIFETMP